MSPSRLSQGKTIGVIGWEAITRPPGWVGPGGHYSTPGFDRLSALKTGSEVRFYLLEGVRMPPNGFEILKMATR